MKFHAVNNQSGPMFVRIFVLYAWYGNETFTGTTDEEPLEGGTGEPNRKITSILKVTVVKHSILLVMVGLSGLTYKREGKRRCPPHYMLSKHTQS